DPHGTGNSVSDAALAVRVWMPRLRSTSSDSSVPNPPIAHLSDKVIYLTRNTWGSGGEKNKCMGKNIPLYPLRPTTSPIAPAASTHAHVGQCAVRASTVSVHASQYNHSTSSQPRAGCAVVRVHPVPHRPPSTA